MRYLPCTPGGELAERLRTGLQIRVDRFDSGTRLQIFSETIVFIAIILEGLGLTAIRPLNDAALDCAAMRFGQKVNFNRAGFAGG